MRKFFLVVILLLPSLGLLGQNTIIQGRILNSNNNTAISSVKVIRLDSLYDTSSDEKGFFEIRVPKSDKIEILFSHPDYVLLTKDIRPELLKTPLLIKLQPKLSADLDSTLKSYKNMLAFAPIEMLFLGLTFEYERRITLRHAVGSYATGLLNQGAWMLNANSSGITLKGIKIEPFYRFYIRDDYKDIGFVQVKLVYANFTINDHHYSQPAIVTLAQCFGIGVAWGWKFMHSRFPRHSLELVLGAKFVPFITEDESMNELIKNYRREYWWNVVGPGAVFDIKFTLGGIF